MEEGHSFMEAVLSHPVAECGEELVCLRSVVKETKIEVAFSETEIAPGLARQFYLRDGLIPSFLAAARELNEHGRILKIEDGYRNRAMQKALALKPSVFDTVLSRLRWEEGGKTLEERAHTELEKHLKDYAPSTLDAAAKQDLTRIMDGEIARAGSESIPAGAR